MKVSRKWVLLAGIAVIVVTNAIALIGAAFNRSGEAESTLRLTERELPVEHDLRGENSGIALRIDWRALSSEPASEWQSYYSGRWGSPAWLNEAKLAALGFRVPSPPLRKQLDKEVFLTLELDGPAYQESLSRAKSFAERKPKEGQTRLKEELEENSRLFAVDADLDGAALRSRYPDRSRYAIVKARASVQSDDGITRGRISGLEVTDVHVPYQFRRAVEQGGGPMRATGRNRGIQYEVSVALGKRLEPWIIGASKRK